MEVVMSVDWANEGRKMGIADARALLARRNPMPTTVLNLTDLDNIIRRFEQAYSVTSVDMLKDKAVRSKISEDVLLRWETYVNQRVRLRDASEQTHRPRRSAGGRS
jgi:hypothetical protein